MWIFHYNVNIGGHSSRIYGSLVESMSKTLIATFGWTEQFVLASILKYGLDSGDRIVLLVPEGQDEKSETAIRDFRGFMEKYGSGIEISVMPVSLESFSSAVVQISRVIKNALGKGECVFNLSGGMRILILAAYCAILLTSPRNVVVEVEREDRKRVFRVPNISISQLVRFTGLEERVLAELRSGVNLASDLGKRLGVPASTFHKCIWRLRDKGLIELRRRKRTYLVKLTPLGEILSEVAIG